MNISRKFFMISVVALALGIPLFILFLLIGDRNANAVTARHEISAGWGGEQSLRGPWLVVPFVERQVQTVQENGLPKQVVTEHHDALLIAPDDLKVASRLAPDTRRRGLHEVVVYQAELALDARFSASALDQTDVDPALLDWSRAYYSVAISDPRGGDRWRADQPLRRALRVAAAGGLCTALGQPGIVRGARGADVRDARRRGE